MSLFDDLDAMARAQGRRESAAREAPAPRRGRHRAPTPPFWPLRPVPRHQRRPAATAPTTERSGSPVQQPVPPAERPER